MGKIYCDQCKHRCRGDVLRVFDKYFHKDCFKCTKCNQSLESGGFFIKDGKFYCQEDYQKHFVAKCKICLKDLIGEVVTALSFSFHRECFKCSNCSTRFSPGNRVTVWQEKFLCSNCISQASIDSNAATHKEMKLNGISSATDDEGCASAGDVTSTTQFSANNYQSVNGTRSTTLPCTVFDGFRKSSKSILRKSTKDVTNNQTSRERPYLSTDSGLGEHFSDSKIIEETDLINNQQLQSNGVDCRPSNQVKLNTLSFHPSRQMLPGRVPNSDYGRHLNHSYIHIADEKCNNDRYKRNVSTTSLYRPRQFHVPEGKNRFLPPDTKVHQTLFGISKSNTISAYNKTPIASSTPTANKTTSSMQLNEHSLLLSPSSNDSPPKKSVTMSAYNLTNYRSSSRPPLSPTSKFPERRHQSGGMGTNPDLAISQEARKLAAFPAGHERDKSVPAPIERLDWPAPPASAVVLTELMRERRQRRREQARLSGITIPDNEDLDSQEALSIDYSLDGISDVATDCSPMIQSGIGQAIFKEEVLNKRHTRSHQQLDPVSASRTPNAAVEPSFKPRYSTHQFALGTRDSSTLQEPPTNRPGYMNNVVVNTVSNFKVRPGYTGGQFYNMRYTSLPQQSKSLCNNSSNTYMWSPEYNDYSSQRNSCLSDTRSTLGSNRIYPPSNGTDCVTNSTVKFNSEDRHQSQQIRTPSAMLNGHSSVSNVQLNTNRIGSKWSNSYGSTSLNDSFVTKNMFSSPVKVIAYEELKSYRNTVPRGIDRTALENYLSDVEFKQVFGLQRNAFYHLPEWKRNDLKRRVELF